MQSVKEIWVAKRNDKKRQKKISYLWRHVVVPTTRRTWTATWRSQKATWTWRCAMLEMARSNIAYLMEFHRISRFSVSDKTWISNSLQAFHVLSPTLNRLNRLGITLSQLRLNSLCCLSNSLPYVERSSSRLGKCPVSKKMPEKPEFWNQKI